MTECSCCGACCEHIWLNTTKKHLSEQLAVSRVIIRKTAAWKRCATDAQFILKHWHRKVGAGKGIWWCDQFNPDTRLCDAHESRPPICSEYPWYGKRPNILANMWERCSYRVDIGLPIFLGPPPYVNRRVDSSL